MNTEKDNAFLRYGEDIAHINDLFSASWIMNVDQFLRIETDNINIIEDGCFQPFRQPGSDVRMTRDWLNFAVEHMSKWWKTINIFEHGDTLDAFIETLDRFGQEPVPEIEGSGLSKTIAIIPFMAYRSGNIDGSGEALTLSMLNATLRSMSRYGLGRVVVVVPTESDREAYEPLVPHFFGQTSVVFRVVTDVKTRFAAINMPYAAITGLQQAFELDNDNWLGDDTRWEAVYLTEADTLLHLKPEFLSNIMNGVINQNRIVSPHRLQPIPHASDFPQSLPSVKLVPDNDDHKVQLIDSYATCCLDSGDTRPSFEHCGNFWYLCGFSCGDHSRLLPYELMRLSHGLGITMLMGSEHGRQCHIAN